MNLYYFHPLLINFFNNEEIIKEVKNEEMFLEKLGQHLRTEEEITPIDNNNVSFPILILHKDQN